MSIDYKAEIKKAKAKLNPSRVEAIVLGASGAGKSALAGTFPGKILYLYGSAETHGPQSATTYGGGSLDPICVDENRKPDETFAFMKAILGDTAFLKEYDAIVLDSATVFEAILRQTTQFKTNCLSAQGKHNSFAEPAAVMVLFNEVLSLLRDSGKHYLVTCILDVKDMDIETGEIIESSPRLGTYSVAEGVVQQFADVFVIGPMVNKKGESARRLQFCAGVSKVSKDVSGAIRKMINFNPRLTGVKELPPHLAADMKEVIKLKGGAK